jgi:DNA-binding MarR family transcriptional regulator
VKYYSHIGQWRRQEKMKNTTGDRPHLELLTLLQQFTLETERYVDRISTLHGLHRTDMSALAFMVQAVRAQETVTPGKLGKVLNLSSPATTALLDRLDRAGHISRQREGSDRRQVQIALTDQARELGSRLFSPLADRLADALDGYAPDELRLAHSFILDMITATIQAYGDIN